jgi:hypothetical protein
MIDEVPKRLLIDAITKKSFLVTGFEIVTVDVDGRQARAAMGSQGGKLGCVVGHEELGVLPRIRRLTVTAYMPT